MKWSSLWAIALAASLATGTTLADQKKISEMTREEIRAEVKSVCENPERMKNIIDPDNVCEYSLDNGKTWREYIPSMPTLPNGTAKIAWGWLGALLLLLGTGAAIMRYRKKDKKNDPQVKFLSALKEATDKWAQYKGKSNLTTSRPIQEGIVEPTIETEQIRISPDKNNTIESLPDWANGSPDETTWDWDEVEKILAAENAEKNRLVDAPDTVADNIDSAIQDSPNNKLSEVDELLLTPTTEPEISSAPINTPSNSDVLENAVTEDEIKEKLQPIELTDEEKKDITHSTVSITNLIKRNIDWIYWFIITVNNEAISLIAKSEWSKLYYLNIDWVVEKTQNFTSDNWVVELRTIGKWYYRIIYTNNTTQNIYLVKWDN